MPQKSETKSDHEIRRKLVVVGDGGCGKTSLLLTFAKKKFPEIYVPTVFENYVADSQYEGKHGKQNIQLALWDTAGQEDYDRLRPLSYPDSHVVLICFDVSEHDTFDNVEEKWFGEVERYCGVNKVPVLLVGCKTDKRDDKAKKLLSSNNHMSQTTNETYKNSTRSSDLKAKLVRTDEGKRLAAKLGFAGYCECSAKQNKGVDEVFRKATQEAVDLKGHGQKSTLSMCGCVVC